MSAFTAVLGLFVVISLGLSQADNPEHLAENERRNLSPEYLDMLLENKQYDLYAKLMDIPVSLIRPNEGERNENPRFNKELELGDILPAKGQPLKEESRQGINFGRYPGSMWPNTSIPYVISNQFNRRELNTIADGIRIWNSECCVKLNQRRAEKDYVMVIKGNGCWSYLGRTGGKQDLSLGNGCVRQGTILHEFMHALGFAHEHNRYDRDDHVKVLEENISDDWKPQYEITNSRDYGVQCQYDYNTTMHYRRKAPDSNKDAFRVPPGVDINSLGMCEDFTQLDICKIKKLYNC